MSSTFSWSQPTNLRNNAAPVDPSDAATKAYVDAQINNPSGPNGAVQFNAANEFSGSAGFTTDGQNITIGGNINGSDLNIIDSGNITFNPAGNIILSNDFINGLANPIRAQDAATKAYVDSVAVGLQVKTACQLATADALPSNTYNNGIAGVGATLTATANGPLTVDGVVTAIGYRILVKNEAAPANNGIYVVTSAGGSGSAYVLTRSADCDQTAEFNGAYTFIQGGDTNQTSGWICTASVSNPVTVGTTAVTFVEFSRAGVYTAGPGLNLTGTEFTPDVDGSTVYVNPSNQISIPADAPLTTPVLTGATGDNLTLSDTIEAFSGSFDNINLIDYINVPDIISQNISANVITANGVITDDLEVSTIAGPSLTITTTEVNGIITISPQGTGNISVDGSWITGVNNPVNAQDAATKAYVDNSVAAGYGNANVAAYLPAYTGNIGGGSMSTVAIGISSGANSQGTNSVAVGAYAGQNNQSTLSVAVGFFAGGNVQGTNSVAIGHAAGAETQGIQSVAIGWQSGYNAQGNNAIAIGNNAGQLNQGANSIALGAGAGQLSQPNNSIFLNATGTNLNGNNSGLYVAPIRNDNTSFTNTVYYNTTTKELTYSTLGSSSYANANVATYLSTAYTDRLGIANVIAIGQGTSNVYANNTANSIAIGVNAGNNFVSAAYNVTPPNFIAIGTNAGQSPVFRETIAIGNTAGQLSQAEYSIAMGTAAGQTTQGRGGIAVGAFAGMTAQGQDTVAIGLTAGELTQGAGAVAIGGVAGGNNQSQQAVAVGGYAGAVAQGYQSVAIGYGAAQGSLGPQGQQAIAIGINSANTNQGNSAIAIGNSAATLNQGVSAVAIGSSSGANAQGTSSVAIGSAAGSNSQGANAVAIGTQAGNSSQGVRSVAIGQNAGLTSQGSGAIAIGYNAGNLNQSSGVAIGVNAAANIQGLSAIAVGTNAGLNSQGQGGIAIGADSGLANQGFGAVSLGYYSSQSNQGNGAIAIGAYSGQYNQAANSISIGTFSSSGGTNSIAIGANAYANSTNTIVLNATGANLVGNTANAFFVNPIRSNSSSSSLAFSTYYNPSTSEVTYSQLVLGARVPFNAAPGTVITLNNLAVRINQNAPCSVQVSAVSGNLQANWGGYGLSNGNLAPYSQSSWVTIPAGTWNNLGVTELTIAGDHCIVILNDQFNGSIYRITVMLLSGSTFSGLIERLV